MDGCNPARAHARCDFIFVVGQYDSRDPREYFANDCYVSLGWKVSFLPKAQNEEESRRPQGSAVAPRVKAKPFDRDSIAIRSWSLGTIPITDNGRDLCDRAEIAFLFP